MSEKKQSSEIDFMDKMRDDKNRLSDKIFHLICEFENKYDCLIDLDKQDEATITKMKTAFIDIKVIVI